MIVSGRPTLDDLANTFAPFLDRERVNQTALPRKPETRRDKFERKYGMVYTAGAVLAGIGIFCALRKGGKIFDFKKFAQQHLQIYSARTREAFKRFNEYPFLQKARLRTASGISKVGQWLLNTGNFIGNLNPFKDIAFDKITKVLMIKPIFDKIQKIFTKSAKRLSFSKYTTAAKDLKSFTDTLQEAIGTIKKSPSLKFGGKTIDTNALAETLSNNSKEMLSQMRGISDKTFSGRFDRTVELLNQNSEKEFLKAMAGFKNYEGQSFFGKIYSKVKETGDFIPAKIMEPHRKDLYEKLLSSKQKLSNNILDLYQNLSKSVDNIFDSNCINDDGLRQSYLKLRDLLVKFREPAKYGVKRGEVRTALTNTLNNAVYQFERKGGSTEKAHALKSLVNLISSDKKGLVEETVSALKVLKETSPELYNKLIQQRNTFQKSLNEAISFETEKTYRKLLDFSLHSLPTDFLTMGIGAGGVAFVLANRKKSRREKISVNLEKGIPVLGAIVVSFLSNIRQVASGTGSIFLGIISGIILNRIGRTINHIYLKAGKQEVANNNSPKDLEKLKSQG